MKKFSKLAAIVASSALALTMGAFALTGCGGGTDYTFEAEKAVLADPAGTADTATMTVESATEWANGKADGNAVTSIGYFTTAGQTITWNINAAEECDVKLTLRAASTQFDMMGAFGVLFSPDGGDLTVAELNLADGDAISLKVNGTDVALSGKLPGLTYTVPAGLDQAAAMELMGPLFSTVYRNFGTVTVSVHLKAGANEVVIASLGQKAPNIDKIVINSATELTWTETDNSSRPGSHN